MRCLLALLLLVVLTGCSRADRIPPRQHDVSNLSRNTTDDPLDDVVTEWPFRPDAMRIHPLTRVRRIGDPPRPLIEVWVEFSDRWGDPTKALGKLEIDLYELDDRREEFITQWLLDLRNLDDNDRYWDNVTRMYLFRLEPESDTAVPDTLRVRGLFLSTEGLTLDGAVDK